MLQKLTYYYSPYTSLLLIFMKSYKQRKATSILQAVEILDVKHIDIPPKTYYKINEEKLLKVLKNSVVHEVNN